MSIQSNINNTIGQAAILASLNSSVQELSNETKAKRELSRTEKQLEELDKQSLPEYKSDKQATAPVFKSKATSFYYNSLLNRQQSLSIYMQSKGKDGGRFFEKAYTESDILRDLARGEWQRRQVIARQMQKQAEAKAA